MVDVLNENGTGTRKQVRFNYTNIFPNHYNFIGSVDNHNKKCDDYYCSRRVFLDITSKEIRWENRGFIFKIAPIKVNASLTIHFPLNHMSL